MSFLDIFRSPGRKLTKAEQDEIDGIEPKGDYAAEQLEIAATARKAAQCALFDKELAAVKRSIELGAKNGAEHVELIALSTYDKVRVQAIADVAAHVKNLGFRVSCVQYDTFVNGCWKIFLS